MGIGVREVTLWMLAGPLGRRSTIIGVRYRARSGEGVALPVQAAPDGAGGFDVAVADPSHKSWWRHFRRPAPLEVLTGGRWRPATAVVVADGADAGNRSRYAARFPRVPLAPDTRMVRITLDPTDQAPDHGGGQS